MEVLCATFNRAYSILEKHFQLVNTLHFDDGDRLSNSIKIERTTLHDFEVSPELDEELTAEGKGLSCSYYLAGDDFAAEEVDNNRENRRWPIGGPSPSADSEKWIDGVHTRVAVELDTYREVCEEYGVELNRFIRSVSADVSEDLAVDNSSEWYDFVMKSSLGTLPAASSTNPNPGNVPDTRLHTDVDTHRAVLVLEHIVRLVKLLRHHHVILQTELLSIRTQIHDIEGKLMVNTRPRPKVLGFLRSRSPSGRLRSSSQPLRDAVGSDGRNEQGRTSLRRLEKSEEVLTSMCAETEDILRLSYSSTFEFIQEMKSRGEEHELDLAQIGIVDSSPTRLDLADRLPARGAPHRFESQPLKEVKIIHHYTLNEPIAYMPRSKVV